MHNYVVAKGSKGASIRTLNTDGRLPDGIKDFTGGLFNKNDLQILDRKGKLDTDEPSAKPLRQEPKADL